MEFWEAMNPEARDQLMKAISPIVTELREFGLGRQTEPRVRPKTATSDEQDAMLDLVRIHDLFAIEWDEGKWR